MPPEARAAYDAANAAFRVSDKTPIVSDPSDKTPVDEKAREAAALVVNSELLAAEMLKVRNGKR